MIRTVGLKMLHLVPVLFAVSLGAFFMLDLLPGDPAIAIAGEDATIEQLEQVRSELGLDRSLAERYVAWLGDTLQGDLGRSLVPPVQDVSDMIQARLPVTLEIALLAFAMSLFMAIPMALLAAHGAKGAFDRVTNAGAFAAISVPSFLGALLLIFFFVFHQGIVRWSVLLVGMVLLLGALRRIVQRWTRYPPGIDRRRFGALSGGAWVIGLLLLVWVFTAFPSFPRQGFVRVTAEEGLLENLRHAFLPALTLAMVEGAVFMRLLRGDLLATLQSDFILAARAKGMPTWRVLLFDALRPSSFSLITVVGVAFGRAIGGTVIVETVFNLPGMGTMIVEAIGSKDVVVVQAAVLVIAVFYVVLNAFIDLSYSYLDPRIRRGRV